MIEDTFICHRCLVRYFWSERIFTDGPGNEGRVVVCQGCYAEIKLRSVKVGAAKPVTEDE